MSSTSRGGASEAEIKRGRIAIGIFAGGLARAEKAEDTLSAVREISFESAETRRARPRHASLRPSPEDREGSDRRCASG